MAILTVNNIKKDVWHRCDFWKMFRLRGTEGATGSGLVGINGSGKTTLFKILNGEYTADEGSFTPARETSIGYMEQHVCRDMEKPAFDEVMTVFEPLLRMEAELERLNAEIAAVPDDIDALILKQTELNDRFIAEGGLTCRNRARSTLIGLGFAPEQIMAPIGVLSGGQKAKIQLAKMLLGESNLLLLDEPTNHLDIPSVEWLEDFLKNYSGSYIVISHDRYFLDAVTNRTFEIEHTHLTEYKGNYTKFLRLKEENRLAMQRVYDNTQREIQKAHRGDHRAAEALQSGAQLRDDREQAEVDRPAGGDAPENRRTSRIRSASVQGQPARRQRCADGRGLALQFGDNRLFRHVNLDIKRGEKVFSDRPERLRKTSLLKILLGIYRQTFMITASAQTSTSAMIRHRANL